MISIAWWLKWRESEKEIARLMDEVARLSVLIEASEEAIAYLNNMLPEENRLKKHQVNTPVFSERMEYGNESVQHMWC